MSVTAVVPAAPTISSQVVADPSSFAPAYTKPTLVLGSAPIISDLSISAVQPVVPALTSVIFTSIDSALDASAAVFTTATVSSASTYTGSAPAYTKPTIVLGTAPTISDLSINAVPPDFETQGTSLPTYEEADAAAWGDGSIETEISKLQDYIEDEEDVELANAKVAEINTRFQRASEEFNNKIKQYQTENAGESQRYQSEVQAYQAEVNAQVQVYQQNLAGDIQVWQAERATDLQKYGSDIQNELNEFNKENVAYQSAIQESIQELQVANQVNLAKAQADLQLAISNEDRDQQRQLQNGINDMKAIVDDNGRKIAIYQAEAGLYQTEIGKEVQEYQQNLAGDLQVWQAERQTDLQKYGSDIQNELNEYNKENAKYQAILQEYIQEAQLLDSHEARKLQKYQTEVGTYSADVNQQVQEYTQKLSRYQLEVSTVYQAWAKTESDNLQVFQLDIQNELNEFNKENAAFGYEVQKALADAQATNQIAMQNGVQEARDAIENNNAQVQRFQSMAQHYATQVNEDVQKYTAQVQALSADAQASVAQHGAELQGTQAEYQWLQDQYTRLKAEYDQAFMIAAPKQQAAPQAARA